MRSIRPPTLPLVAVLLLAGMVPAAPAQTKAPVFELRGKVVNSLTGEPVSGALLQLPGQPARFSDSNGNFAFAGLPRGRLAISARKPGFFNEQQTAGWVVRDASFEIPSDEPVVVKLTPEAVLSGQVKNADGQPIEDVEVLAERWQVFDGQKTLQPVKNARTDDEGNFRLAELLPGKYYLAFSPLERNGAGPRRKGRQQQAYGRQFYPGVADLGAASPLPVRAGAEVRITQTLSPQRVYQVAGTIRNANPGSYFDLQLVNSSGESVERNIRVDRRSGDFRVSNVPAGNYLLALTEFHPPGPERSETDGPLSAAQPIQVSDDLTGVMLSLGAGLSLAVRFHDETSSGPAGANRVLVHLQPKDFIRNRQRIIVPAMPESPQPATRFENLYPGAYFVEAQAESSESYIASLRCGSVDLLRGDLVIAPGAAPPPIEVTLRDDGAQLTVAVEKTDRAAPVLIYSEDSPRRSQLALRAAGEKSVSIRNLSPGAYRVLALNRVDELEFRNPAAMEKYLGRASSVTLEPRGKAAISVEMVDVEQPE